MKEQFQRALLSLKNANLAAIGFILIIGNILGKQAGIGDAICLIAVSALYGYKYLLSKQKDDILVAVKSQLVKVEQDLATLKLKTMQVPSTDKAQPKRIF